MDTIGALRLLFVFEFVAIILGSKFRPEFIVIFCLINLVLVSSFGGGLIELYGMQLNITTLIYSYVVMSVAAYYFYYGKKQTINFVKATTLGVAMFMLVANIVLQVDFTEASLNISSSYVFDIALRTAVASLTAYIISSYIFILILERYTSKWGIYLAYMLGIVVMQIIDSSIFYSVAFAGIIPNLFGSILIGITSKVIIGFCLTPIFYFLPKKND